MKENPNFKTISIEKIKEEIREAYYSLNFQNQKIFKQSNKKIVKYFHPNTEVVLIQKKGNFLNNII
jgi:hypothetical protein